MKSKLTQKKVAIILPAYNAERTIEKVYKAIPKGLAQLIILVDDGSKDKTVIVARKLGIKTIVHEKNLGYGANQKTCYKNVLKEKADYIIMLHPDGQYNPKDLPKFVKALKSGKGDLVLGSRFLGKGKSETPFYKVLPLKAIALMFNLVLNTKLTEANSGYRGYKKEVLEKIPFTKNGNGYIFDPQAIIQTIYFGFKIFEVPISKQYNPEAISPNLKKSIEHGFENLKLLLQYIFHSLSLKKADFLIPETRKD